MRTDHTHKAPPVGLRPTQVTVGYAEVLLERQQWRDLLGEGVANVRLVVWADLSALAKDEFWSVADAVNAARATPVPVPGRVDGG